MARRIFWAFVILFFVPLGLSRLEKQEVQASVKIRFGILPVLQALPLFVAQDKGFFRKHNVDVEIVPFNTAAEKEIALASGSIDGYFGDLVTPIVLKGNGRDVLIMCANYDARRDRRMFAIMGKPGGPYHSVLDLEGIPIAVSSHSVIHYVTELLLESCGLLPEKVATIESKNIGLRMQMLIAGQVEAATLPEPLVTAAQARGAVALADDSGLPASQTVLVFSGPFVRNNPNGVRAFLNGVTEANKFITSEPDAVRSAMVEHCRLPETLKDSYPVPRFPALMAPDREAVKSITHWLSERGVIRSAPSYEQVVDVEFLP